MNKTTASKQIGIVTNLGYLLCCTCARVRDKFGTPVMADSPHRSELCDGCERPVENTAG